MRPLGSTQSQHGTNRGFAAVQRKGTGEMRHHRAKPKRAQCGRLQNTCLKEALKSNSLINLNYIGLVALFIFNLLIDLGFLEAQEL